VKSFFLRVYEALNLFSHLLRPQVLGIALWVDLVGHFFQLDFHGEEILHISEEILRMTYFE
jgi:hypothetical protein